MLILRETKNPITRTARQTVNDNWKDIESNFNNVVQVAVDNASQQIIDSARLIWQAPVAVFADLTTTYPDAVEGWASWTREVVNGVSKAYRYNGSAWVEYQEFIGDAINEVDERISQQLLDTNNELSDVKINTKINVAQPPYNASANGLDVSISINQAIEDATVRGGGIVYIPPAQQSYMVDALRSIVLKNSVTIELGKGTVLEAIPNSADNYAIIKATNASNIAVVGRGVIRGERNAHLGTTGEWGMGIDIRGCNGVVISDVEIYDCWGDGIYIGSTSTQNYCRDVVVERFKLQNNRRQGISLISAINLIIRDGFIADTNGTAPGDGIDIEPNNNLEFLQNILIENIKTENNMGSGIKFYTGFYKNSKNTINIVIKNHTDKNSRHGLHLVDSIPNVKGIIRVENAKWENDNDIPFYAQDWAAFGPRVELIDAEVVWGGVSSGGFGYLIGDSPSYQSNEKIGNVHLTRPRVTIKEGAINLDRGIYFSGNRVGSVFGLANIIVEDPVALSGTIAKLSLDAPCENLSITDRYNILSKSVDINTVANGWNLNKNYDNAIATETVVFWIEPELMPGQTVTFRNLTGLGVRVIIRQGYRVFPFNATEINTAQKGASLTVYVGEDKNVYVENIIGTWAPLA